MIPDLRPFSPAPQTSTASALVGVQGLSVHIGPLPVLRDLDLRLDPGEALALTGANGSGKSTLLRVLATLLRPSSGRLEILGAVHPTAALRRQIALVAHEPALHPDLSLIENLRLVAALAGCGRALAEEVLAQVGLAGAADRAARACSEGMRRRAELARVLLCRPRLLLLDEAHAALDTEARRLVSYVVGEVLARGGGAVLVTHDPDALAATVDRVAVLRSGRLHAWEA